MKNPLTHWRVRREGKAVSVRQAAKKLGVTTQAIYLWESGRVRPRRKQWERLARLLNLPVTDLIRRWASWHASLGNDREADELRVLAKYFGEKRTQFPARKKQAVLSR